jgi:hypothetical protein
LQYKPKKTTYLPHTSNLNTLLSLALYADNDNTSKLNIINQLDFFLLTYTQKNNQQKDNNLILDNSTIDSLKKFFDFIEA